MAKRTKKLSKSARPLLKIEALEQRQLLATGFTAAQGQEFANITHANGNVYDQILLLGPAITYQNDAALGQITRVSLLDAQGDIVQIETGGAGTFSISLDGFVGPAEATKYAQPGIKYVSGNATVTIQGADASTNISIFSVGTVTANGGAANPIFAGGLTGGNNVADVARLTIVANPGAPNGSTFGGIRAANALFSASSGVVGITAANVQVQDVVRINDLVATGSATPTLVFGTDSQFGAIDVQGGGLVSTNGKAINNTGSYAFGVNLIAGTNSGGVVDAAENTASQINFTGPNPFTAINNTFTLTNVVDLIPGLVGKSGNTNTNGDDTINATLDNPGGVPTTQSTFTTLDDLNGGSGNDTLNIIDLAAAGSTQPAGITVTGIETVNMRAVGPTTINSSTWTGVTALNVIQATAATVTAPSTTAINVAGVPGAVTINGGSTVTASTLGVAGAGPSGAVLIGNTTPAAGAVTVTTTGVASTELTADTAFGAITVNGGTTVSVTQSAGSTSGASTDATNFTVTQGAVTVNGSDATTSVTVNQTGPVVVERNYGAATVGVKEVSEITFVAMTVGQTAIVTDGTNALIFTAAKALTADEAAAAFANLGVSATNGASIAANGTYSGALSANFTSGAAAAAKVTFTGAVTNLAPDDLAGAGTAAPSAVTTIPGVKAVSSTSGRIGVVGGMVAIDDVGTTAPESIASVTLTGFGAGSTINSQALTTLSLASSFEDVAITNTLATTLGLTLNGVGSDSNTGVVTAPTYTTINLTATGTNSWTQLTATSAQTLVVNGSRVADLTGSSLGALKAVTVAETAGLTLHVAAATLESVTTSTTGTTKITIDPTKATYTGGGGVDEVTTSVVAGTKAISLGGGNDKLTLATGTTSSTGMLDGGDGTDTLTMVLADAAAASALATFETQFTGFEKIGVANIASGAANASVNVDNLDDINYVVSAGSSVAAAAVKEVFTVTLGGGGTLGVGAETVTFDGTSVDGVTIAALTTAMAGAAYPNWTVTGSSATTVTFQRTVAGVVVDPVAGDFTGDAFTGGALTAAPVVSTQGAAAVPGGGELTVTGLANAGTLEITGAAVNTTVTLKDATGTADSLNLITSNSGDIDAGTVTAAGVETANYTATDSNTTASTHTLTLAANDLTSLTVTGSAANITVNLTGATDSLTMLDGSALTGKLTNVGNLAVAQTTKGGSGADTLTAGFANSVLMGNGGDDTLSANGKSLVTLTGGAGNDLFDISAPTVNVNAYATVDATAGDRIKFAGSGTNFVAAAITLDPSTAVFQDYANAAIAGSAAGAVQWFQYAGNTYVVQNVIDGASFTNAGDVIVKVNGLVNLANASYNLTSDTLLIV